MEWNGLKASLKDGVLCRSFFLKVHKGVEEVISGHGFKREVKVFSLKVEGLHFMYMETLHIL